jgi:hypothetical protein
LKLFLDLSSKQKDFNQKFSAQFAITGIQYTVCEFWQTNPQEKELQKWKENPYPAALA